MGRMWTGASAERGAKVDTRLTPRIAEELSNGRPEVRLSSGTPGGLSNPPRRIPGVFGTVRPGFALVVTPNEGRIVADAPESISFAQLGQTATP